MITPTLNTKQPIAGALANPTIAHNGIDGLNNAGCTAAPICSKSSNVACCCGTAIIHHTCCPGTALHTSCTMPKTIDRTKKSYPSKPIAATARSAAALLNRTIAYNANNDLHNR